MSYTVINIEKERTRTAKALDDLRAAIERVAESQRDGAGRVMDCLTMQEFCFLREFIRQHKIVPPNDSDCEMA